LSWVPTNSGLVQDAGAVGEVCAELGVPYLLGACQAVGQRAVEVDELKCDFLGGTARKFLRGPRGIGFLYVSGRMLERGAFPLFLDMRGADWTDPDAFRLADGARRFENWEFAYALVAGMCEAARYTLDVGVEGQERARSLAAVLRERLAKVRGMRVLDRGRARVAIVTVDARGRDASELGNTVPAMPLLFLKPATAVIGDGAAIALPADSTQVDFEGEIGVVIGSRLRRATEQEVRAGIAGITCVNDVTARDLQRTDEQWTRAKGFAQFCSLGTCSDRRSIGEGFGCWLTV